LLNLLGKSHPFPVIRLKELKVWVDSGKFDEIISGTYSRRDEHSDDLKAELEEAVKAYKDELSNTKDPLGETINKLGNLAQQAGQAAGKQAEEFLKNLFGR
jgi:hypothetical protein